MTKIDAVKIKRLADTIRILSAEAVQKANSGHPGMPMGAADYAAVLWSSFLRFNPKDPRWAGRDRFVLSAGHGSMLLYSLLHLFGFDLPMSQLQAFRQWESLTPGHPEFGVTPGVETTTGPLGQGVANGVGLALSAKMMGARYSKDLFNYRVYGIVSDGDLMEGVASEAASLAGHLKLDNITYLYDDNEISIGGSTEVCFTEDVGKRFESYGWNVSSIDGHNIEQIAGALSAAAKGTGRPNLIIARTTIGWGSPAKAGKASVHGEPLGADELAATKKNLGWSEGPFTVPSDVGAFCCSCMEERVREYEAWQTMRSRWEADNQVLATALRNHSERSIPEDLDRELESCFKEGKKDSTRNLSGAAIQIISKHVPGFVGGSADLEPSTKTLIKDSTDIVPQGYLGKNLRFGVREHAMGAIANGLAYDQSWIPFTATFLVFSDYMRPTLRLAALSHLQTLFIFTHDSFWVGEDGPTHQPIEHVQSLRLIPGLHVYRPADGFETAASYLGALRRKNGPAALLFTRQNLAPLIRERPVSLADIEKGAYVVSGSDAKDFVFVATGSEVAAAVEAASKLTTSSRSFRVVSMPCVERFLEQPQAFRDSIIPPKAAVITVEAGRTVGWERIAGTGGLMIGIDHYGASAPGELLAERFGFTGDAIAKRVEAWLAAR